MEAERERERWGGVGEREDKKEWRECTRERRA
jgi:hypothetical protein